MKTTQLLFVLLLSAFSLRAQDSLPAPTLLDKRIPAWVKPVIEKSEVAQNYRIIDQINPFYLEADFTGDKLDDIAFFVESKFDGKKGVMIINRGKNTLFVLGAGKDIGMGDHVNWCQTWFVYRDKGLFDGVGSKKAVLKYPAIRLEKSEKISLFVYWSGKKYKTYAQVFAE
jgi:hypothetical protein